MPGLGVAKFREITDARRLGPVFQLYFNCPAYAKKSTAAHLYPPFNRSYAPPSLRIHKQSKSPQNLSGKFLLK